MSRFDPNEDDWADWYSASPEQLNPVDSSHLARVKYSRKLQILLVQFTDDSIWMYDGVEWGTYMSLLRAESIGSYFHYNIRTSYPYEEIG